MGKNKEEQRRTKVTKKHKSYKDHEEDWEETVIVTCSADLERFFGPGWQIWHRMTERPQYGR
jgi:hypothetical protein